MRAAGSAGQPASPIVCEPPDPGHGARLRSGAAEVVPGDDRLDAGVPLPDVRDAGGAVRVTGKSDLARVQQLPERVVGGVEARLDPPVLLGRVAGPAAAARHRLVRVLRRRQQEVDRVLGAVVERAPVGLRGDALALVGRLAERVALALALGVERQHDVAVLGQRLRGVPVHLLVGLDRAVGDHDPGALGGAGNGGPDVPGERRAVARGEQDRAHDPVAVGAPVVEPDVARAAV